MLFGLLSVIIIIIVKTIPPFMYFCWYCIGNFTTIIFSTKTSTDSHKKNARAEKRPAVKQLFDVILTGVVWYWRASTNH